MEYSLYAHWLTRESSMRQSLQPIKGTGASRQSLQSDLLERDALYSGVIIKLLGDKTLHLSCRILYYSSLSSIQPC